MDKQFIAEILSCLTIDQYNFLGSHLSRLFYLNVKGYVIPIYGLHSYTDKPASQNPILHCLSLYFNEKGGLVNSVCGYILLGRRQFIQESKMVNSIERLQVHQWTFTGFPRGSRLELSASDDCYIKLTNIKGLKYNCDSF